MLRGLELRPKLGFLLKLEKRLAGRLLDELIDGGAFLRTGNIVEGSQRPPGLGRNASKSRLDHLMAIFGDSISHHVFIGSDRCLFHGFGNRRRRLPQKHP